MTRTIRVDGKTYRIKGETQMVSGSGGVHNAYPMRGNAIYRATREGEIPLVFVFKNELGWVTSTRSQMGYMTMKDVIRSIVR